ncbi:hypothetical protein CLM71_00265 [Serratia sp. MYb239]|nr:hypothetical protein CLM71_00265 [Serratia sp. MYb239]
MSGCMDIIMEEFSQQIKNTMEAFGVPHYSYVIQSKYQKSDPIIMSNFPKSWIEKYRKFSFHKIDPILVGARNSIIPFQWQDQSHKKFDTVENLKLNANLASSSLSGYTFPLHDHKNNFVALSVCHIGCNTGVEVWIEEIKCLIQESLASIHNEIVSFIDREHNEINNKIGLTEREKQVVYWASQGKTYNEISIILSIKEVTVKFHVGNILKKFGTINMKQTIRCAVEYQCAEY